MRMLVPLSPAFTAGWAMPIQGPLGKLMSPSLDGPISRVARHKDKMDLALPTIPEMFHFDMNDIAEAIKLWIQSSLESWYDFVGTIFETMINLILYTPKLLILNPQVQMLWMVFISVTVGLLSILCVVEGVKTVLGYSRVNFSQFLGRTVIAFAGISIILPAMTIGLDFVNQFVTFFTDLAFGHVKASEFIGNSLATTFTDGSLGIASSLIFILLFLYYMFKVLMNYGRRWFDIIIAACISPMAIGATVFDSTSHYFKTWWTHVLQLYMVQVVHAVYVTVLAVVILTPAVLTGPVTGFMKILIIIGALWRMSTPPRFVSAMSGSPDSRNMLKDISRKLISKKFFSKGGK